MAISVENDLFIVKTKLFIPPIKSDSVLCGRLMKMLTEGEERKLTLISAPAGFGKTTVVCQWFSQHQNAAWYSLDESDDEPTVFYRYLIAALNSLDTSFKTFNEPLHQGRHRMGKDIMVQLINHLSDLDGKYYLVLDDFHHIRSESILNDIYYLLQNSPPQFHLTLITRTDPKLQLSKIRASDEILEMKSGDLQFTLNETVEFFHKSIKLDIPKEKIQTVYEMTEGWIVGLQVIGLSLKKSHEPEMLVNNGLYQNRYLLDYFFEEVLTCQSQEVQDFLLKTSVLNRLNKDLCSYITDGCYNNDLLTVLERNNLFIVPLDENNQWFRYHSLFAQMLRRRLENSIGQEISLLYRKAAEWCFRSGYIEESFNYAVKTGDDDFLADLLENSLITLMENYEWALARRWLERIPLGTANKRFLLQLLYAYVVFLQEDMVNMDSTVDDLEEKFELMCLNYSRERKKHVEDLLLSLKINNLYYRNSASVIETAEQAVKSISSENHFAAGLVRNVLSTAYMQAGNLDRAIEIVREGLAAISYRGSEESPYIKVQLLNRQVWLEYLCGRLNNAMKLLTEAFAYARREDLSLRSAMAMFNDSAAHLYFSRNELDKAMEHAVRCIEFAKPASDIGYLLRGMQIEAFIYEIRGNSTLAFETMDEVLRLANETKSPVRIASAELAAVELALMQARYSYVEEWEKITCPTEKETAVSDNIAKNIISAKLMMADGLFAEARKILQSCCPERSAGLRTATALKIDLLISACLYAERNKRSAIELAEDLIRCSCPEGWIRLFIENSDYITEMLFILKESSEGVVRIYAEELLKVCTLTAKTKSVIRNDLKSYTEALSEREVEILNLIVLGLSNREITEQENISMNTVKTHIRNIYSKLEVSSRKEAIIKARDPG